MDYLNFIHWNYSNKGKKRIIKKKNRINVIKQEMKH